MIRYNSGYSSFDEYIKDKYDDPYYELDTTEEYKRIQDELVAFPLREVKLNYLSKQYENVLRKFNVANVPVTYSLIDLNRDYFEALTEANRMGKFKAFFQTERLSFFRNLYNITEEMLNYHTKMRDRLYLIEGNGLSEEILTEVRNTDKKINESLDEIVPENFPFKSRIEELEVLDFIETVKNYCDIYSIIIGQKDENKNKSFKGKVLYADDTVLEYECVMGIFDIPFVSAVKSLLKDDKSVIVTSEKNPTRPIGDYIKSENNLIFKDIDTHFKTIFKKGLYYELQDCIVRRNTLLYAINELEDRKEFSSISFNPGSNQTKIKNLSIYDAFSEDTEKKILECYKILSNGFIYENRPMVFMGIFKEDYFIEKVKWTGTSKELNHFINGIHDILMYPNNKWARAANCFLKKPKDGDVYQSITAESLRKTKNDYDIEPKRLNILNKAIKALTF